jgi:hypothetical protein
LLSQPLSRPLPFWNSSWGPLPSDYGPGLTCRNYFRPIWVGCTTKVYHSNCHHRPVTRAYKEEGFFKQSRQNDQAWGRRTEEGKKERGIEHGRMARGGHGLPKVSPRPAIPYPSTPCGWAIPETAVRPVQGWSAQRLGGLRPSSTLLNTPHRTPMGKNEWQSWKGSGGFLPRVKSCAKRPGREI